jgi:hypothetical protein
MDNATLFLVMSGLSGVGWLLIVFGPCRKSADKVVTGVIVALLAAAYGTFNFAHLGEVGGPTAFFSYEGAQRVFANPGLQLAAWAHILAADLVAGVWMLHNARRHRIRHLVMIPVYLVTIVLGPLGVLLYLVVRTGKTLNWFADNGGAVSGGWRWPSSKRLNCTRRLSRQPPA